MKDHNPGGEDPQKVLDHENMDVYRVALEFAGFVIETLSKEPKPPAFMSDQLGRASTSIVLNIAEGSGKFTRNDKIKFYKIATASATECAGALDLLLLHKTLSFAELIRGKKLVNRVVAMLIGLVKSLEKRHK